MTTALDSQFYIHNIGICEIEKAVYNRIHVNIPTEQEINNAAWQTNHHKQ